MKYSLKTAILLIVIIFLATCGREDASNQKTGYGGIAIKLIFPSSGKQAKLFAPALERIDSAACPADCPTCDKLYFTISGSGMTTINYSAVDYSVCSATLYPIPAGNNRSLSVDVKNASSVTLYTGSASGITVPDGGNSASQTVTLVLIECSDGSDNDGDTLTDYPDDPGCTDATDTSEYGTNECDDGVDNTSDTDTLADMADPGCSDPSDTTEADGECDDTVNNDSDGLVDYPADPGCTDTTDTSELNLAIECDDGNENDLDGLIDWPADPGCTSATDTTEINPAVECDDGVGNDLDGLDDWPTDPGCTSATDTTETNAAVECDNGSDDDGDTLTDYPADQGCTDATDTSETRKIGADVRITNDASGSYVPSLVWTGTEYGVSWEDARDGNDEIYFARIDMSGNKIGTDVRITNDASYSRNPSLIWTGTEYGVSWIDRRDGNWEIYFARIDASGNKIGADVRITNDASGSDDPSLVWTGTEYGVSWWDYRDGNEEIYFARIDASGNKIGVDVRITNDTSGSWWPSLVWTGTEYGVSWHDYRDGVNPEIYFARIDASGNKIGADVRITNDTGESKRPSLVWAGTEYGVSWDDYRDGNYEIYFARLESP